MGSRTRPTRPPIEWRTLDARHRSPRKGARRSRGSTMVRTWPPGANPATEVYTIRSRPRAECGPITAIRLEALPDDSLPDEGAGPLAQWQFRADRRHGRASTPAAKTPSSVVKLKSAPRPISARRIFDVAGAIDDRAGNRLGHSIPRSASRTRPSFAARAAAAGRGRASGCRSRSTSNRNSPQHQFGRLRLSVTDAADPRDADGTCPAAIARKSWPLAAAERSDAQQAELRTYYRDKVSPRVKELQGRSWPAVEEEPRRSSRRRFPRRW